MNDEQIKAETERLDRELDATKRRHKIELLKLTHALEDVRAHCEHKTRRTRSIMGRDEVTWCETCGKEW